MIGFISILVPAFLAVGVYEKLEKRELTTKQFILCYFSFLIAMLFCNEFVLNYIFHKEEELLSMGRFINIFAIKYLALSIVEVFILPYLYTMAKKNIQIKLEVGKKNEKKRNN